MKDRRYANRGKSLEDLIQIANQRYSADGTAMVCKIPVEFLPIRNQRGIVVSCKVSKKSSVDFIGRYIDRPVAFEAKNTNTNRISFSEVQPHQEAFLDGYAKYNAHSFVVVAFNKMADIYVVPWEYWKAGLTMWRDKESRGKKKEIFYTRYDGKLALVSTTGMASFTPEDLPIEWKVTMEGKYVLPYLHKTIGFATGMNRTEKEQKVH